MESRPDLFATSRLLVRQAKDAIAAATATAAVSRGLILEIAEREQRKPLNWRSRESPRPAPQ